jgi:hypothetical protein
MLDSPSTAPNDVPPDVAKLDRSALEQRLVAAEAKLEKHLPYEERFDRDERSPESEARLKPFLDKVFATKPGVEPPYKFECRARLCRITPTKDAPEEWVRDIQTDPDAFALTAGASFGASRAFLQLDDPDLAAGKTFLRDVLMPLRDQKPINECKAANPAPGRLVITLVLDAVTRRLHVETSGSLASQASGLCIRKIFDDLVSKVVVPPEVKALPSWPIPFDVP